ncbi:uncharacterized protein LOC116417071 [Nasonia vitripennis]|uniref:Integrase catalytic domain-containing protein n=1 Tax=Nasonia vitripennis TaxID=7425 RepID=A0A7M7T977_NASVI|nr:uncharacterized protein LOC116417071 [Nasonia vitripennis]
MLTGNNNNINSINNIHSDYTTPTRLVFIADSGATEHIVNKSIVLSNFRKSSGSYIRSANKNKSANISIDSKGDLIVKSLSVVNNKIILTNVITAKNISNDLISLRRFADMGLSIYLDNKILKIYDRTSGDEYLTGIYEKPNWIISLNVINQNQSDEQQESYDRYSCMANIVSLDEFLQQSQTDIMELDSKNDSVETNDLESTQRSPAEIGREKKQETREDTSPSNQKEIWDGNLNEQSLNRKILDLDKSSEEILKHLQNTKRDNSEKHEKKLSEGMLWHIKLGHASLQYLLLLQKSGEKLKKIKCDKSILDCEVCILAKMENLSFSEVSIRATKPLERIHTDTMGPIKPVSYPGESKFIICFIDDHTRFAKAYSTKHKSESGYCLEKCVVTTRNLLGKDEKVCFIRTDNGTEFTGGKFSEVMKRKKIEGEFVPPYTSQHNGTAERFNKTIQWKIRALMIDSGLPKSMWMLALEVAIHIYNRTPHKGIDSEIPIKKMVPNGNIHLEKIGRFGCLAYAKIPNTASKFAELSEQLWLDTLKPAMCYGTQRLRDSLHQDM